MRDKRTGWRDRCTATDTDRPREIQETILSYIGMIADRKVAKTLLGIRAAYFFDPHAASNSGAKDSE